MRYASLSTVSDALPLRAWALRLFAGVEPGVPAGGWPRVDAWRLFLRAERCALPLCARLGAAARGLPPALRAELDAWVDAESKRFLAVAAEVRMVAAELRRRGWSGVALKGGAAAADGGEPVDVVDLDLLLRPEHAGAITAWLEGERGYQPLRADPGPTLTGGWEMAPRMDARGVLVEVHFDVPHLGEGVSPWEGARPTRVGGVDRPAPATHLWHLLVHSVVHHVERRGQLRELVLLRHALDGCTPPERAEVRARAGAHPAARALLAAWEMAEGVGSGREPAERFRGVAAARLAVAGGAGVRLPPRLRLLSFAPSAFAMAAGDGEYARLWYGARWSVLPSAGFRGDTWLDRRLPAAAWSARVVARAARLAAGFPSAWRLHRALRPLLDERG